MRGHAVLYVLSLVIPALVAMLATPVASRLAVRMRILDQPSAQKFHSRATPYLGGVAVAAGLVAGASAAGVSGQVLAILLVGLAIGMVGLLDDRRPIGPGPKLAVETLAGVALWVAGVRASLFHVAILDALLTVAWMLAVTNAFNLLDNMDGLTTGVAAISALSFFAIAAGRGDYLVAAFSLAVTGACVGFLRGNFPPARIFLGDAGSLLLGFIVAAIGLKLDLVGNGGLSRAAVPALAVAVPLFDTCFVVVSRLSAGRPITRGGTDHSSHRLASFGLPPRGVATTLYGVQVAFAAIAVWLVRSPSSAPLIASVLALAAAIGGLWLLLPRDVIVGPAPVRVGVPLRR